MFTMVLLAVTLPGTPGAAVLSRAPAIVRQHEAELRTIRSMEARVATRRRLVAVEGKDLAGQYIDLAAREAKVDRVSGQVEAEWIAAWKKLLLELVKANG